MTVAIWEIPSKAKLKAKNLLMSDTKKTLRIGLIGAGGRAVGGYVRYFAEAPVAAELVAVADPSPENMQRCLESLDF